ncbi:MULTISPECIES: hypothetical protein [Streptomyces]|uniref:Uncharacterized protein n=1 Tax=Streptomyces changanensis TaxID=2964669 RepID=A0ABY5NGG6_9ACTN|nr:MULTISPECIES: hypothetical protein [Streptomyces]UUS35103.1 hypothetical protein NRO40_30335 [Streptomyces changanensis]
MSAANGVLRDFGCSGAYRMLGRLPEPAVRQDVTAQSFCGIKGLTLPAAYREGMTWSRTGGGGEGPAGVCEVNYKSLDATLRLTTVVDPALSAVFSRDVVRGGIHVRGTKGNGTVNQKRAVYEAACQTGPVVFMVEQRSSLGDGRFDLTRALLPPYVAAEAERIGCGPEKVVVTDPPRR